MKKIIVLAALASVALASCTKSIPVAYDNGKDVAITFSPISQRVGTKANVFGEQNATYTAGAPTVYEDFAAWAYYTNATTATVNPQTNDDSAKGSVFFENVTCEHNPDNATYEHTDYWAPTTTYLWPKAGYLHFHAMSPAVATGTRTHLWASGFSINDYVAPVYTDAAATGLTTDASQIDLMYSDFVFNQQRASYNAASNVGNYYDDDDDSGDYVHDGVNLLFRHALSLVQFKVKTADNYATGTHQHKFYVRKIEVLNAYNTGDFTENRANTANNNYAVPADMTGKIGMYAGNEGDANGDGTGNGTPFWSDFKNEVTLTPYDVTAGDAMTGTLVTNAPAAQVGTTLITLPQALVHTNHVQVRVKFDYQFSTDSGLNWIDYTNQILTVDLSGAKGTYDPTGANTANYVVNNWLINHKYVYTLTFKLDPIIFDPAVVAYVEVQDIGVDLPVQN